MKCGKTSFNKYSNNGKEEKMPRAINIIVNCTDYARYIIVPACSVTPSAEGSSVNSGLFYTNVFPLFKKKALKLRHNV